MAMQAISSSSFHLTSLGDDGVELGVQFYDETGDHISQKTFTFAQTDAAIQPGEILDVYSQNGKCADPILKTLFSNNDEKGIGKAAKKLKDAKATGPIVLVLDLKDQNKQYQDAETIAKCEATVCDFFTQPVLQQDEVFKHAKKVHKFFLESQPLDFVICEGSLKADLLPHFTQSQTSYLQGKGAIEFCQCAEFFMNGFKLGQEVSDITATKYVKPVSPKFVTFEPHAKSTVWYPELYKHTYAPDGAFAQTMRAAYTITGDFDPANKITTLSVEL